MFCRDLSRHPVGPRRSAVLEGLDRWRVGGGSDALEGRACGPSPRSRRTRGRARPSRPQARRTRRCGGEEIPGFGHPLCPEGDPRAGVLIETAPAVGARPARLTMVAALVDAARAARLTPPTLDVGVSAIAHAFE